LRFDRKVDHFLSIAVEEAEILCHGVSVMPGCGDLVVAVPVEPFKAVPTILPRDEGNYRPGVKVVCLHDGPAQWLMLPIADNPA